LLFALCLDFLADSLLEGLNVSPQIVSATEGSFFQQQRPLAGCEAALFPAIAIMNMAVNPKMVIGTFMGLTG
jgi:hypothetical protein